MKSEEKISNKLGWFGTIYIRSRNPRLELSAASAMGEKPFPDVFEFEEFQMFNGRVLTVVEGILGGGKSSYSDSQELTTRSVFLNHALIGEYPWSKRRKVKSVRFSVGAKHEHVWFSNFLPDTTDEYMAGKRRSGKLTRFSLDDNIYTISLNPSFTGNLISYKETTLSCKIEFKHKVLMEEAHRHVRAVLSFFSFSVGRRVYEEELKYSDGVVSPIQYVGGKTGRNIRKWHECIHPRRSNKVKSNQSAHNSIFPFYTVERSQKYLEIIPSWVKMYLSEKSHSACMIGCLDTNSNIYNEGRLLRAFAWFESIPKYKLKSGVTQGNVDKIVSAAHTEAEERGYAIQKQRIKECLSPLKFASLKVRIERAFTELKSSLPVGAKNKLFSQLERGISLRNKIAHGSAINDDDDTVGELIKCINAIELFCYIITLERHNLLLEDVDNSGSHSYLSYIRALREGKE